MFDIVERRSTEREQLRIADLMNLTPQGKRVLEIGARDCYLSRLLTNLYSEVVALDLTKPCIEHEGITAVSGDVTALEFEDDSFDTVFCTEVIEHIRPELLQQACDEIARVAKRYAVIGVPYRQDLRAGRLKCNHCGGINATTGHLGVFDREKLESLFGKSMRIKEVRYVGFGERVTNPVSVALFRACGYPYGTYDQEENCIHCGEKMERPGLTPLKWSLCFIARFFDLVQNKGLKLPGIKRPNWIHIIFEK